MKINYGIVSKQRSFILSFAIITIIYHNYICILQSAGMELDAFSTFFNRYVGSVGVDIFIFLSGMSLYHSMKNSTTLTFWRKRAVRVLLPYFLIAGPVWYYLEVVKNSSIRQFIRNVFWIRYLQEGKNTYWYILFIILAHLVYPLIYKYLKKDSALFFTILLLIVTAVVNFLLGKTGSNLWNNTSIAWGRIPIFLLGCYYGRVIYEKKPLDLMAVAAYIVFSFALMYRARNGGHFDGIYFRYVTCIYGIGLCLFLALIEEYVIRSKYLEKLCKLIEPCAYEMYLWNITLWALLPSFGIKIATRKGYLLLVVIDIILSVIVNQLIRILYYRGK